MKIIFPGRKVPEDKKELEKFINRYVMDLNEYYYKINNLNHTYEDDLVEPI